MRIGDAEYVARVQQLLDEGKAVSRSQAKRIVMLTETEEMGHKHTQLTESECESEVKEIVGGAVSSFAEAPFRPKLNIEQYEVSPIQQAAENAGIIKRKRGRPPGSKNRPKSGEK